MTGDWELVGHVGVDAGMVMVGDPCYLDRWVNEDPTSGQIEAASAATDHPYSYLGACGATCGERQAGQLGDGDAVAVASGYGDGFYPVFVVRDENGRIAQLVVDFVGNEDIDLPEDDDLDAEEAEAIDEDEGSWT